MVATTRGGPPEFVHDGRDGVLVDPSDTERFALALQDLLADDNRRRAIADAGRVTVESFAWPIIARRYQQIYSSVIDIDAAQREGDTHLAHSHQGESVR